MAGSLRAFVAVELTDEARQAIATAVEGVSNLEIRGLRPVRPENVHLTLKFLGDTPEDMVEAIVRAVSKAVSALDPFTVTLDGVGVFPNPRKARVLWVSLGGDLGSLGELHEAVERAVEPLGFPSEERDFRPHLTVARLNDRVSPEDRHRAAESFMSVEVDESTPIPVDGVSLMKSTLGPEGASYEHLAEIPLRRVEPRSTGA